MIPIPLGRNYITHVEGWVWRAVRCEFCGCEFAYQLTIKASGMAHSPLFLANGGAKGRARDQAEASFSKLAKRKIGLAPCPDCGRY
jgi:hypothetical protein